LLMLRAVADWVVAWVEPWVEPWDTASDMGTVPLVCDWAGMAFLGAYFALPAGGDSSL